MAKIKNYVGWMLMSITAMVMMMLSATSCTDEFEQVSQTRSIVPGPDPEEMVVERLFKLTCVPQEQRFDHTGESFLTFYERESLEPVKEFKKTLLSWAKINLTPDTVRISDGDEKPYQTAISIDRSYKGGIETDNVIISMSDGRVLSVHYEAEHVAASEFDGKSYAHGHDSLITARALTPENHPITKALSQYVKEIYITKYPVEVTTQGFTGDGKKAGSADLDTLYVYGITKVLADDHSKVEKTGYGVKVINETQQRDSVVITKTWTDGYTERIVFNTILNRWLKNIERREIIVNSFDGQTAGNTFSVAFGDESLVRSDANWRIYGREVTITKVVTVDGHSEEVRYTYYQERAEFNYESVSHSFEYVNWEIHNFADKFTVAPISDKSGYDQLNYRNEIQTYYLEYVQMSSEDIAWYKAVAGIDHYKVINAKREDFTTYTHVYLEKVAVYTDGTSKKVGEYSANLPIAVSPLTNWTINTSTYGTYVSNEFSGSQTGKTAKTAEKFFSYNQFSYRYNNTVAGEENALSVSVPNDIVFNDGDVKYNFANTALSVAKKSENTRKSGSTSSNDTYAYTCTAGVTFGANQEVTLPGTIIVDTRSHEHGKITATYMTTTPNEDRGFYKSVAVLQFEDGYRMVGMCENHENSFNFTMTSTTDVNSAVYADGRWMPAKASDDDRCMRWRDESGASRRVLDYITATRDAWNNGHNTVVDVRREGRISADGYSVTFYLNGEPGQTLNF